MAAFERITSVFSDAAILGEELKMRNGGMGDAQNWYVGVRLLAGALIFALFPIYVVVAGPPSLPIAAVLTLLILSVLNAIYLTKAGNKDAAHVLGGVLLSGIVLILSLRSGGLTSPMIAMLLLVPVEAALSNNRRIVFVNTITAYITLCLLIYFSDNGIMVGDRPFGHELGGIEIIWSGLLLYAFGTGLLLLKQSAKAEQNVKDQSELYRLLAEHMSDVVSTHSVDGRALFVSPAITRLLGTTPAAVSEERWLDLVHPKDRGFFLDAIKEAATSDDVVTADIRMQSLYRTFLEDDDERVLPPTILSRDNPDGLYKWVAIRCRSSDSFNFEGDEASVIVTTRDATLEKVSEATLRKAREEAERTSEAKSRFLANMSHELRTPLNAVIGFSEVLEQEVFGSLGSEQNQEYARLIRESGTHLLQVVNDILDMSKIETGKFAVIKEPFQIAHMIESCQNIMDPIVRGQHTHLEVRLDDDLPECIADKRALKQMLLNLLSNAIKFSGENGRVIVDCRHVDGNFLLSVEDNGIGISSEDIPRLGQPFFQVDNAYSREHDGTGLGLSVVRGLVELHGGEMKIESQLGKFTKVTLVIPQDGGGLREDIVEVASADDHLSAIEDS